ncbi:MAG TPA: rhodanese-like domain-containing protein [Gammaproteobacteria bacterium]|nr:rhodanese-like domain-containing protein [Gammaproteobacteria bacterium]
MYRYSNLHSRWVLLIVAISCSLSVQSADDSRKVKITADIGSIIVNHQGVPVTVERIQDTDNRLADDFTKTSRPCPPFCIHPIIAAQGVRTIGELELLEFLQHDVANEKGLLIDARMPDWYNSETIPGAVNTPFVIFTEASPKRDRILQLFGATADKSGKTDYSRAIRLTLFCNGPWCDQSPRAIKGLISAGYPADKIQYYRGGMQAWKSFGLTTVLPESNAVDKQ